MNKFLSRFLKKKSLRYDGDGVEICQENDVEKKISWLEVNKVIFVGFFEEYSGCFLTDDFLNKKKYQHVYFEDVKNSVKIRTGSSPVVKSNVDQPFAIPHGTTNMIKIVLIEYTEENESKGLYAIHYEEKTKKEMIKEIKLYLPDDKVLVKSRLDGFAYI